MLKTSTICDKIHDFNQERNRPCKKRTIKQKEFMDSYQFKRKRKQIKNRNKYPCEVCMSGKYEISYRYTYYELEVHRILPIEEVYNIRLDCNNLITLFRMHHEMSEEGEISKEESIFQNGFIVPYYGILNEKNL